MSFVVDLCTRSFLSCVLDLSCVLTTIPDGLQSLKPEYAKAATELKEYDDKIVIAKVSAYCSAARTIPPTMDSSRISSKRLFLAIPAAETCWEPRYAGGYGEQIY